MKGIGQISSRASAQLRAHLVSLGLNTYPNFEASINSGCDFVLLAEGDRLSLASAQLGAKATLEIDFFSGNLRHRRHYGGGRNQDLAKAVGLNRNSRLSILDATSGLGRDAFVMTLLGANLLGYEQNQILAAMLQWAHQSALEKALADKDQELIEVLDRLSFERRDSGADLEANAFDVVYLDPMFPERQKSAKVKKEMQILHQLLSEVETEEELLFDCCLTAAGSRLVIKRPLKAPFFAAQIPQHQVLGKTVRYDLYVRQALPD